MKTQAAIYFGGDPKVTIADIELEDPRSNEVLVRVKAVGICHTDIGMMSPDPFIPDPIVLGHEGVGIIEKKGKNVKGLELGDAVILSIDHCEACHSCKSGNPSYCENMMKLHFSGRRADGSSPISFDKKPVNAVFFAQSSFSSYAIAPSRAVIKIANDLPFELMAPLGCGIQTGAGTVLNIMEPQAGQGIAVFGVGTVGLSAIMAAKISGCHPIIAIDTNAERLSLAAELGAHKTINPENEDPIAVILTKTNGRGIEYSFDTTGQAFVIRQAVDSLFKNGLCVMAAGHGDVTLDGFSIVLGKTIRGTLEGGGDPQIFIPHLIELFKAGKLPIDKIVTCFPFSKINDGLSALAQGRVIKPVLIMP